MIRINPSILSKTVKVITPKTEKVEEAQIRGTIAFRNNEQFVRLDGAPDSALTPISDVAEGASDAGFVNGDRVLVLLKNHQAIVTKNLTVGLQAQAAKEAGSFVTTITDEGITAQRIIANDTFTNTLRANHIKADDIIAGMATIDTLDTNYAHITEGVIDNAKIGVADVNDLEANYAHITQGVIDNAKISVADVNNLSANYAHITNGVIDNAKIGVADVNNLSANYAHITSGVIDNAKIGYADVNDLNAHYAHITSGVIDNAKIGYADVNDLDANFAHISNGVIDNAQIGYADVKDLNAHYANINLANVNNAWIENGVIKNGAIADAQIIGVSANKLTAGTIDASNITVTNLNASNITTGSITVDGITIDVENNEASIDGEYIEDGTITLSGLAQDVTDKIDGAIETFTGAVVPTLNNYPASSWTTTKVKDSHIGDVYYVLNADNTSDGYCYRFAKDGNTYKWVLIKDSDVTAALSRLTTAEGKISGLESFESTTSSWITDTDEELSSIKTNHTTLVGVVDKTLVETVQLWFTKANTTAPNKPTARVTTNDASKPNMWNIAVPTYNSSYPNYYYCYQWKYADSTYGWSSVTRDIAMGESQSTARTAASDASSAVSTANTASTNASNAVSTANTASTNASTALSTANTANTNASTALSTANTASTNASNAVSTANTANSNASSAVTTANAAQTTANSNIKSSVQLWFTKANTTAPSKPTAHVTTNDASKANMWNIAVPTYNASYPHYYYCYEYQKGSGDYTWSDVVYDRATTENQSNARSALSQVATKVETSTFNTLSQTVDSNTASITSLTTITENNGLTASTNITNTVNTVSQTATGNSSKISSLTTTLGTNADGTTKTGDIVHRTTAVEQDLSGFKTTVSSTYETKTDANNAYLKVVSRGEQLVTNGNGMLGNNTNFSQWTFDGSVANSSPGSFTRIGGYANIGSDEHFSVSADKRYRFEFDMKSANNVGTMYSMLLFYDVDKRAITASDTMFYANTLTTLTQELKAGDTVVHLADVSKYKTYGTSSHQRALTFWDYKNTFGYQYPPETYSRNHIWSAWTDDSSIDKTNNTITLATAYTGVTKPVGTYVSQGNSGDTYKYGPLLNNKIPVEWTHYVGYLDGTDYSGLNKYGMFPPATAYCKVGFLWNYNSADDQFWVTNIQVYEDYKTAIDNVTAGLETVKTTYVKNSTFETTTDAIRGEISAVETTTKSYTDGKISQEVTDRNSAITQKANEITQTVSETYVHGSDSRNGDIVTWQNMLIKDVVASIEPIQDLHGYDKPWSGGNGKNFMPPLTVGTYTLNGITAVVDDNGLITVTGTKNVSAGMVITIPLAQSFDLKTGQYIHYRNSVLNSSITFRVGSFERSLSPRNRITEMMSDFEAVSSCAIYITGSVAESLNFTIQPSVESDSTATSWTPYTNICPISGRTEVVTSRCGKNLWNKDRADAEKGYYNIHGTFASNNSYRCLSFPCSQGDKFIKSGTGWGGIVTFWNGNNFVSGINATSVTIPSGANIVKFACTYASTDAQLELGTTATAYEAFDGTSYTTDLGRTVYGGTLDVVSGVLTVDRAMVTYDGSSDEGWTWESANKQAYISKDDMERILRLHRSFSLQARAKNKVQVCC